MSDNASPAPFATSEPTDAPPPPEPAAEAPAENHENESQDPTATSHHQVSSPEDAAAANEENSPDWKIKGMLYVLGLDSLVSLVFLAPWLPWIRHAEDASPHYTFASSLTDLAILAAIRVVSGGLSLLISYWKAKVPPEYHFDLFHPNGERKSQEELDQETLEEPFGPWVWRFLTRPSFTAEFVAVLTQIWCIAKCLVRMNLEIGTLQDAEPFHPLFWLSIFCTAVLSAVEATYLETVGRLAAEYGQERESQTPTFFRTISSQLLAPLLEDQDEEQPPVAGDDEDAVNRSEEDDENQRAVSDIKADTDYKADWSDLLMMCYQDVHLICVAFVFLLLAAFAQVLIPRYLGKILDALAAAFGNPDGNPDRHISMWDVPHFMNNVKLLVVASVCAGVFAGMRGSIFTVVGARVNVRLRVKLMDALLSQDIGFFDITKTGDITSRLSSDTTLVGDQVSLNVNVFLRSLVQAIGVLLFMFMVSWQLSILAFISVPLITLLSKWYGNYVRLLTKLMQKKLADGNSVSEAALGSMATVRAFDAAVSELEAFESYMSKYLHFTRKAAVAYFGFATLSTSLPELVFAVVVFYGGMLVRNGDLTSGQLVSFLLYLQSLSDAFSTIGWVFSSLTQAVGAADKVFELMHRNPRITPPSVATDTGPDQPPGHTGILGIEAVKTRQQRTSGLRPESARGEVVLENVEMYYPARPKRRILNGMSLTIPEGSIVALVGQSGGGKSSVMSLLQHLYEQSSGKVLIDGIEVHELCPEWLSRNISTVSQEPTLFARSIKKNIMYGLEGTEAEPTDEAIVEAAKLANADSFIQQMPQKYDTEVGERGVQLSGGQKQRVAIARALVRKPKVLLLDEATSALDAESEHLVEQAIDDMIARGKDEQGRGAMTVIIVAHRLSTVRSADCIYVVKDGQVVEQGRHDDLIQNSDGAYSSLIRRQMEAQARLENAMENGARDEEYSPSFVGPVVESNADS